MPQTMTVGERLKFTVEGRVDGQRARFTGAVTWAVAPPGLVLAPSADGLVCAARAVAAGDCTVSAAVPGLPVATFDLSVLPADATTLVIVAEAAP